VTLIDRERPAALATPTVDQVLVARIHRAVGEALTQRHATDEAARRPRMARADERALSRKLIADELQRAARDAYASGGRALTASDDALVADAVFDRLHGLAGIQPLLDDPEIRDIHISGADGVWITRRDGRKERAPSVAAGDEELIELIATAARRIGRSERRWDYAHPELNLQLPNGDRLHALMAVTGRPTITIRRHDFRLHRLEELFELGVTDDVMTEFLGAAVRAKRNVIVAGGTGTGKTTMLRCLINEIDRHERIITIEDSLEIGLEHFVDLHPDQETIESRDPNTEGVGEFSMSDGVRAALRMDPDRVIVGEVRGAEVLPMLLAMSQGNDGSMCSIHADSSKGVFGRLAMYAAMTRERLDPDVTNLLVANAIDLIVHVGWVGGVRRVSSVREVTGIVESGHVASNELWRPGRDGRGLPASPPSVDTLDALVDAGFDRHRLTQASGRWAR
jgi:Flp pilus assembly CpaF family ATPase